MNNYLEQFSEERLIELAEMCESKALGFPASHAESAALARIALAAKQDKPKFEEWMSTQSEKIEVDCGCVTTEAFYHWLKVAYEATPQPAHTEQDNPVAWLLSGGCTKNIVSFDSGNAYSDHSREVTPLYTTQQTRHAGMFSWIECSERMPETYLNVLLTDEADDMCIGQLESHDYTDFFVVGCPRYKATHWMQLPAVPKPESEL